MDQPILTRIQKSGKNSFLVRSTITKPGNYFKIISKIKPNFPNNYYFPTYFIHQKAQDNGLKKYHAGQQPQIPFCWYNYSDWRDLILLMGHDTKIKISIAVRKVGKDCLFAFSKKRKLLGPKYEMCA